MSSGSYDYDKRQGVWPVSWEDFHGLCKALALAVAAYNPEIILPVGRGGYYPGTLIAHLLQAEPYPVRVSRRVQDVVCYQSPRWIVEPPPQVRDRRVLVVDEMSSSGETLQVIRQRVIDLGAYSVRSAVLYAHRRGADIPDYIGIITDALVLNPWDREIVRDGELVFHPEYAEALVAQGDTRTDKLRLQTPVFELAKSIL